MIIDIACHVVLNQNDGGVARKAGPLSTRPSATGVTSARPSSGGSPASRGTQPFTGTNT